MKYIKIIITSILIALCALSYHPSFQILDLERGSSGSKLTIYISFISVICLLLNYKNFIWKNRVIVTYIFLAILIFIELSFFDSIFPESNIHPISTLRTLILPLIALIIGYSSRFNKNFLLIILYVFIAVSVFTVFAQIMTNIGGFIIEDIYLVSGKNSLGAIVASSEVALIYLTFESKSIYLKSLLIAVFAVTFLALATMMSRTSIVCVIICSFITVYYKLKNTKNKSLVSIFILFLGAAILFNYLITGNIVNESIDAYLYNSFTRKNTTDITSGRLGAYEAAFKVLNRSPWLGEITFHSIHHGWIHNYLLLSLASYGFLGSLFIIILYFYLLKVIITNIFKSKLANLLDIGFVVMLVPFVTSMAEPTFPYGPGTVVFFPFLLLGISIGHRN